MQLNAIWIQWYDTQLWNAKIYLQKFRCQLQQNFLLKFIYLYSPSWRNDHLPMGQKIGICIPLICFKIDINYALANSAISNRKAKEKYVILIIWNNCWLRIIDLEYIHTNQDSIGELLMIFCILFLIIMINIFLFSTSYAFKIKISYIVYVSWRHVSILFIVR